MLEVAKHIEQFHGLVFSKNINSEFIYINKNFAQACGYDNVESMIGTTDYDIKGKAAELADIFVANDNKVMAIKRTLIFIQHLQFDHKSGDSTMLLVSKDAMKNDQNEISGTFSVATDISNMPKILNNILLYNEKFLAKDRQFSIQIEKRYEGITASKRETQVLFYLLRGYTAKSIGKCLNLSPKTIEKYIERLKLKLNCQSKAELIERCIGQGLIDIIPEYIPGIL